ncbi:hypothetical protein AVENLUH5627_03084 [Acinetobacter venetianus]|uniref:Uncharacterized protein n=1 Tax=Acinetobacter venetianus TaxID=52133 RepID=A0A150HL72_9GAMM|nr:hypothetical protein [Acinetobacter venetianus]KXZ64366.1 hypothetical protein AVENLUH5627_03084 [Acinetobacter venetianus]
MANLPSVPSNAIKPVNPNVSPQQLKKADDDVGKWFMGLLDGSGTGPSQIIVTAVLGCVPVVGQLFDLRDLIKGIILVSATPANVMGWVDLVITLIGCIPGFGDAFKAGFKLAKNGENAERVFDAMRKYAKIDPKKALKEMDWNKLKNQCISLLNKMIDEIVDVLDSWLAKQVIGRPKVNEVIRMFTQVKKDAPNYMNAAFAEIQKTVNQMLNMHPPLPSTAIGKSSHQVPARPVVPTGSGKGAMPPPAQRPSNPQRGGAQQQVKNNAPTTQSSTVSKAKKSHEIRQAKKKRWSTGVPAEHIVDYYSKDKRKSLRKINDHGRLIEEYERLKRNAAGDRIRKQDINQTGIDHLWFGNHKGRKYLVGETKGSIFGHFSFLAGMAQSDAKAIEGNRSEIGKIFDEKTEYNEQSGLGKRSTSAETSIRNESVLEGSKGKAGLGGTKAKGRQMSHKWIGASISTDNSISPTHKSNFIIAYRSYIRTGKDITLYNREIYMVTGKQYEQHDRSKGKVHNIQMPLISIPDNTLVE